MRKKQASKQDKQKTTMDQYKEIEVNGKRAWKCECGAKIMTEKRLMSHLETKTHDSNMRWRQQTGNTAIFVSLLKPGMVYDRR